MNERETFEADQADAVTRDQQAWETNMASAQMDVAMKAAHAQQARNVGQFWAALADLLNVAWVLGAIIGLAFALHLIKGWF